MRSLSGTSHLDHKPHAMLATLLLDSIKQQLSYMVVYQRSTWCFDLHNNYWTKLTHKPSAKPPRTVHHIAAAFNKSTLLIYGGFITGTTLAYNGIWLLRFHNLHNCSGEWINMTNRIQGGHLPLRQFHSATIFRKYIIFYGGLKSLKVSDEYNSVYDESITVIYTTQTGPNLQIQQILISPAIPVRYLHSLSVYTSEALLLMGGASSKLHERINNKPIYCNSVMTSQTPCN